MADHAEVIAEFGRTLARIRHARCLTGPQVETLTQGRIWRSTLSRIENGSRPDPHLSTLLTIAAAYECDFLISRKGRIEVRGTHLTELLKGDTP